MMKNFSPAKMTVVLTALCLAVFALVFAVNRSDSTITEPPAVSTPSIAILRQLAKAGREAELKAFADAPFDVKLGILQSAPFLELHRDDAMVEYIQKEIRELAKVYKTEDPREIARLSFIGWGQLYGSGRHEKPIILLSSMAISNRGLYEEFTMPEDFKANIEVYIPRYLATADEGTIPAIEATQEFATARRAERAKAAGKYITPAP